MGPRLDTACVGAAERFLEQELTIARTHMLAFVQTKQKMYQKVKHQNL